MRARAPCAFTTTDEHGRPTVAVTGGAAALLTAELLAGAGNVRTLAGRHAGGAALSLPGHDAVQNVGARFETEHGVIQLQIAGGLLRGSVP